MIVGRQILRLSVLCAGVLAVLATPSTAQSTGGPPAPLSDADITRILAERIDAQQQSVGIVVGVLEPGGRRVLSHGHPAKGDPRRVDGDTVFEIGSITKVFTALLLADTVARGEVALTTGGRYLPASVRMPRGVAQSRWDLASQDSGLPRLPKNMTSATPRNPYADYSVAQLYAFLSGYELPRDPGAQYRVLESRRRAPRPRPRTSGGHDLRGARNGTHLASARHAQHAHHAFRRRRAASRAVRRGAAAGEQLGLPDAGRRRRVALFGERPAAVPVGGDGRAADAPRESLRGNDHRAPPGRRAHTRDRPGLACVDGQRPRRRLAQRRPRPAIERSSASSRGRARQSSRSRMPERGPVWTTSAATCWTGRFRCGRNRKRGRRSPWIPLLFDRYAGRYQLAPSAFLTISRKESGLFAQLTGQSEFEIFPESPREFFYKVVDAQLTFEVGTDGRATAIVLHQAGRDIRGARVVP